MHINLKEQKLSALREGFSVRGTMESDLEPAVALFNRWSQSVIHRNEISFPHVILNEWRAGVLNLAEDTRVVFAPDGRLVGYIEVWTDAKPPVHPWMWGRVDPEFQKLGIGTWLMEWGEMRCMQALERVPDGLRFAPNVGTYRNDGNAVRLFKHMGYGFIRGSYVMQIDMDAPPPAPVWPEGIALRPFNPETDMEAVYRAEVDAFRDHFAFQEEPFEEGLKRFRHLSTGYEGFDPSLFFVAMDGNEIAGISLCPPSSLHDPAIGWVNDLGVRRPWRKRGLGLALLRHSFGEYYRRGKRKVGLGVDADSLTGALHLYEKAGMHVTEEFDRYEREIRPGKEIRVESLNT